MAGGLADILFAPAGVPEMSSTPPVDGQDFTTVGGQGTEIGGSPLYFPQEGPDPALAELRAAYEKQQGLQQQPSMAGMSLAHAAAMQAPQPQPEQAPTPAPAPPAPVNTAEQDAIDQATEQARLETEAARREAAAEGQAAAQRAGVQDAYRVEQERVEFERQSAVNAQTERIRQVTDEARNTKIDPSRYMKNTNAFGHLANLFAVALGGSMRGVSGGHNHALESIDKRIAQDIAAQESDLDNLNRAVGHERTILGDLREQFQDKAAARAALHIIALDQVTNDFNAKLAGIKDVKAQARGAELLAAVAEKRRGYEIDAKTAAAAAAQTKFENEHKRRTLAAENQRAKDDRESREKVAREGNAADLARALLQFAPKPATEADQLELRTKRAAATRAEAEAQGTARWYEGIVGGHGEDGHSIQITNPTEGAEVEGKVGGAQKTLDSLADAINIVKYEGRADITDVDKRLGKVALANAITFMAQDEKGVPSDADVERIKTRVGAMDDPTKILELLSPEERIKVMSYVSDRISASANDYVRSKTGGKGAFNYKARSLIGEQIEKQERNPETKVRDLRAASEEAPVHGGKRIGDTVQGFSPKAVEALSLAKTDPSNIKPAEARKAAKDLETEKAGLMAKISKEKDPDKLQQHRTNLSTVLTAIYGLNQTAHGLDDRAESDRVQNYIRDTYKSR